MLLTVYFAYIVSFVLLGARESLGKVKFAKAAPVRIVTTTEGEPIDSTIVILNATSDNTNEQVTYAIKSTNDEAQKYIKINPTNGRISNIVVLDSEKLLTLDFQAEAHAGSQKAKVLIILKIKNVNDNPPRFEKTIDQYVDENTELNKVFGKIQAVDADQVDQLFYGLTNKENASFAIEKYSGSITSLRHLDYEKKKTYNLNISVTDGKFTTYGTLVVHVNDMDDHGPKFEKSLYHAYLDEGLYTNKMIEVPIHAYDLDIGRNDSVKYSLTQDKIGGHIIRINSTTGKLYINGNIDYEEGNNEYAIQVEAVSTTFPPVQSIVLLRIKDVNDNAPNFAHNSYHGNVPENALVGTPVLRLSAHDKDQGNNSVFSYRINSTQSLPFMITADGEIQVNGTVDRETHASYTFQVIVEETLTKESYRNHTNVTIGIIDVNDNTPQFSIDFLHLKVKENMKPPVILANLTSVDNDTGSNGERRYSIQSHPSNVFYIDAVTGILMTNQTLDREKKDRYDFQLVVHDLAPIQQRKWSTLKARIDILDDNDNTPSFEKPRYHVKISEAVPTDTFVTTVKAVDEDYGNNSVVNYSIVGGNLGNTFGINSISGEVKTLQLLDRESIENFTLQIVAQDGGKKNGTCELVVTVLDVNDNQPVFSQYNYTFSIYENQDSGAFVGNVVATDKDQGVNGNITYSISSSSDMFAIDRKTGNISTRRPLDREEQSTYILLVKASDSESTSKLYSTTEVFVTVLDINDNRPLFSASPPQPILLYRNQATKGTTIYTFKAEDKDVGSDGLVAYSTVSTTPDFLELNSTTGELNVISAIPKSTFQVKLQVKAYSPSLPSSYDTLDVWIIFISTRSYHYSSVHTASIEENQPIGSPLLLHQSIPVLKTLGMHRQLYCGDDCPFQMTDDGNITTTRSLDREKIDKYTLFVPIEELFTIVPINVTVLDVDDNAPYCTKRYEFTVEENRNGTFHLDGIKDDDLQTVVEKFDITPNVVNNRIQVSIIKYQISNFTLFVNELDYEEQQRHDVQFLIRGKDKRNSSKCYITIRVKDVNDNTPRFNPAISNAVVLETAPMGTLVKSVHAIDADSNSTVTYAITDGDSDGVFNIDSTTGNIYTAMSVSILTTDVATLTLKANDGTHQSYGYLNITIVRKGDIVQLLNTKKKPLVVKTELKQIEKTLSIQTNASIKVVQIGRNSDNTGTIIDVYGIADGTKIDITKALGSWEFITPAKVEPQTSKMVGKSEDRNALIGVIIAMAALLVLVILVGVYLWYQRRKRKRTYTAAVIPSSNNLNGTKHR